jgi:hypothetical protein
MLDVAPGRAHQDDSRAIVKRLISKTKQILSKTSLSPITNFKVSYTAASDSVTLTLASKQTFPTGGQITVLGGSSGKITGSSGAALGGSTAFTISKGGKNIGPAGT